MSKFEVSCFHLFSSSKPYFQNACHDYWCVCVCIDHVHVYFRHQPLLQVVRVSSHKIWIRLPPHVCQVLPHPFPVTSLFLLFLRRCYRAILPPPHLLLRHHALPIPLPLQHLLVLSPLFLLLPQWFPSTWPHWVLGTMYLPTLVGTHRLWGRHWWIACTARVGGNWCNKKGNQQQPRKRSRWKLR